MKQFVKIVVNCLITFFFFQAEAQFIQKNKITTDPSVVSSPAPENSPKVDTSDTPKTEKQPAMPVISSYTPTPVPKYKPSIFGTGLSLGFNICYMDPIGPYQPGGPAANFEKSTYVSGHFGFHWYLRPVPALKIQYEVVFNGYGGNFRFELPKVSNGTFGSANGGSSQYFQDQYIMQYVEMPLSVRVNPIPMKKVGLFVELGLSYAILTNATNRYTNITGVTGTTYNYTWEENDISPLLKKNLWNYHWGLGFELFQTKKVSLATQFRFSHSLVRPFKNDYYEFTDDQGVNYKWDMITRYFNYGFRVQLTYNIN